MEEQQPYIASFDRLLRSQSNNGGVWASQLRHEAISRFRTLGFPTTKQEQWRYTNVLPLKKVAFQSGAVDSHKEITSNEIRALTIDSGRCFRLTFVDGHFAPDLSSKGGLPEGVEVTDLHSVMRSKARDVEALLGKYAAFEEHSFVALNTALMADGAYIRVPKGTVVQEPIHLLFVTTDFGAQTMAHPRVLVAVEENAQLTIVEDYAGLGDNIYLTNSVSEVVLKNGAVVDHYKLERENSKAFHIASLAVHQEKDSNFRSHSISLGGSLVRNDVSSVLDGEGGECTLNGLIIASGTQLMDNHTQITHAKPHCRSFEVYNSILDGSARGVFNGKIFVAKDAQKTDAKQTNKSLILSEGAIMNAKPELEIYADDVKCTHGATVGQLDEDALFYLRSRGVDLETARSLLTFAFSSDVLNDIRIESMRETIQKIVFSKLPRQEALEAPR